MKRYLVGVVTCLMVASPASAASIKGTVRFVGDAVAEKKLAVTTDQYVCGKEKDAGDLLLSAQRGIRNAVVWLAVPPQPVKWENVPVPLQMDQKQCVFIPRVVLVPAGATMEFLNSDRLLHNIHTISRDNPSVNRTQPRGRTIPLTFGKPEIVRVNCDLHSWMRAWVVVMEHPFYALTGGEGEFSLPNVPPGSYKLQVWHETLGVTSHEVVVGPQDVTGVVVEMRTK